MKDTIRQGKYLKLLSYNNMETYKKTFQSELQRSDFKTVVMDKS